MCGIVSGMDGVNGMSMMLPSALPPFRSLPVTSNADHESSRGRVTNSSSDPRLMNQHPSSTLMLGSEERMLLQQANSPVHSSSINLEEEPNGEHSPGIVRRNSSQPHSSLSGNPICHPEREDHATMAPTLVLAAAEPHVSLDPDKPCCDSTHAADSGDTETFRKSSR